MEITLGIAQFNAGTKVEQNLHDIESLALNLKAKGASISMFPEYCTCLSSMPETRMAAKTFTEWMGIFGQICCSVGTGLVLGGVPTLLDNGEVRNRTYALDKMGCLLAFYDKIHLFSMDINKQGYVNEAEAFTPGNTPVKFVFEGLKIGISTCFDLRFSELYTHYTDCDLVLCTAAFTASTGNAHWNTLLQARAIEGQFWMAGTNICGKNQATGLELFGHSAVYDPWGLESASALHEDQATFTAVISTERVAYIRKKVPMHR